MRLLQRSEAGDFSLVEFVGPVPEYAILSHTWGSDAEEPTFGDLVDGTGKSKAGFDKIRFCIEQAAKDGLHYAWVDTCCIDKRSSSELSEAINSMFRWYQNATRCYVYLADVSGDDSTDVLSDFQRSRWFQRAWTLQELLAPRSVEFFTSRRARLGDRSSLVLDIHSRTGIPIRALQGSPLSLFSVRERMSWTAGREAKREEDRAYSLLGIFDIHMPMLYGEKMENAFRRLNKEIEESQDVSSAENMEGVTKEKMVEEVFTWLNGPQNS
ncbi:HET-domain-containing protein, partial [Polyplosphaeria fusca]